MAKKNVEERFNAALEQYRNPQDTIDNSRAVAFARQVESFSNDLSSGKLNYDQIEEKQKQLSAQAESLAKWASQNRNSLNASFEGIGKALGVWNDIPSSIDEYRSSPLPNYGWNREAPEAIQAMQTGTIGETPDVIALRDAASRLALGGADPAFKPYEDFYKMKNTPLDVAVSRADDFKRLAEYQSRANGLDGNTRYSSLTREEFQDYTALMDKYHLDTDSLRNMPFDKMAAGYAQQAVQSKQYNTNEEMTAAARSDKDFEKLSATGLKMMASGGALGDYNDRMSVGNSYDTQLKYMTDEQKAIYAYYLAKGAAWQPDGSGSLSYDERRKEADRYYHTIAEDIAYRAAQDAVKERHQLGAIDWGTVLNSGNPVGMLMNSARITNMAIAQLRGAQDGNENASAQALEAAEKVDYLGDLFNTSVGNAFQNIGAGFVTLFGGKNNEDYYTPTPSNLDIQRGLLYEKYTGDSKVRKVVADLVMNTGNVAPQILATTIATLATGGMAAAGGAAALAAHGINTAASIATMSMQVYGESYDEGRRMGMDTNQAGVYGLLNAVSELALGEIMGIAGRAGGTVLSRGLQRIAPNIDNAVTAVASKVGKTAWGRYLANVAGEGLEEYMQDVLEPWFRALATGGESENLDFLSADALYSGLIGMLSAGFMDINGVADIGQEITLYKDAGAQIKSAGTVGQLKSIASTFSADTKAYQLAEKLTEDSKPSEIGKVLKAVGAALSDQNVASMSAYLQEKYKLPKDSADKLIGFFRDYCNGAELSGEGLELLDVNDEITEAFLAEIVDANVSDARRNAALQALAQNVNFAEDMARPEQEFNRRKTDFQRFIADTMLGESSTDTQSAAAGESSVSKPAAEDVRALFNERGNLNASAIDTLVSAYEAAGANQDVVSYVHDAEQAYTYGKYGMNMEAETKENKLTLSPAQAEQAYRLGKLFSGKETSTAIAKVKQRVSNETQTERGAVRFEYDTQRTKLTAREQTSVDVLSGLAQAYNLKLSFFESTVEDSKRVYKTQDGKTVSAPNGYYASKDGTIHIDVHAGKAGQGVVMYTAAHELTHFIRQWSPEKFKTLANFLVSQYGEKGKSVDYYVRAQMQKAKNNKTNLSYDEAFYEFVADSMETMLADGRVAEKLRALKEQDKTLWQKVKDFFKEFAANLKKLVEQYKDAAPDSEEGKFVASLSRDVIEKLEDLFTEGVVGASENFSRANVEGGKEVAPIEAGEPASPVMNPKPERTGIRVDDAYAALGREGIRYSLRGDAKSEVEKLLQDTSYRDEVLLSDNTPAIMLSQKGVKNLPLVMNASHIRENILSRSEAEEMGLPNKKGHHYHGLGTDFFLNVIDGLDDVLEAYRGTKNASMAERRENYFLLISKFKDADGNEVNVPIYINEAAQYNQAFIETNKVSTVFGRENLRDYIARQVKSGELVRVKKRDIQASESPALIAEVYSKDISELDDSTTSSKNQEGILRSDRDASPDTDYAAEVKRMQEEEYSKLKAAYEKLLREVSVKDTLRSENAALRERVAGLQDTLKGMTAPALNPEDVRKYVRSLKKTYMSDVDSTELAVGISKLWHMMADLDAPVSWDALYARATELGRRVIEGASLHALNADPRLTAMQDAYDYFSGNPKGKRKILKISPEDAAEFGFMQGTGKSGKRVNTQEWSDTRKVFAAHGINLIVGTGNTLDADWSEVTGLFPEFFQNDIPSQDELRAVMGFLNEYDFIRDQKAVEVLGGEDIDNMAAWVANNIMDTLNPGLDENGNAKKDAIRQSKSLMQQSEQEMYRQISMHQARLNRVYNREIKRLTAENTAAKQQVKDLGAKIKANAKTYSAEISKRDVQLRDQIIQYEKEIDQLTRRKDAELEKAERTHGDDIVQYEKAIERLNEKIAAAKQQQNKLRQQKNAQIEELRKQKNAEKREAVQEVRESYSRKQQSQKISDVLARIADRLAGAKKKPQTKQGVKSLAETVLTQAEDFFKGNSGADAKTMLNGIANAYADTENAGASYIEGAFRQEVHDNLTELANDLAGKSAKDLTAEELHDIYKALRAVEVSINRAGYLFGREAARRVEDSAAKAILEIETQRQAKAVPKAVRSAATAAASMYWADLKPIYAMRSINSTELSRLFNAMLYDGQATWTKDVDRGREAMLNASQKHGFSKWNLRETHEFTDKYGEKISLNLEQMMYLYACVRRGEQAVNHLTNGGFVFGAPVESKKGKLIYMVRDARAHALTVEELIKIRDTLTDSQQRFVEELQDYLSTVCAADGNGVSMELYGIDIFGEPNYIPVMSAGNFHSKAGEVQFEKEFGVGQKLTGRSFTKRTVKNANNPILLQDFTDVVRGHISDMAQYHAFAVPLTNFQKVFSWAEKQTDSGNRKSVRSALENRFGSDAPVRYLNILLNDLNNSARRDPTETLFDRGLSVFKRSAVAFSLSVAVQQPSAIARTLYVLNPRYFAGAKVERAKAGKTWEQLRQYSSTARLKDIGGFDVGMKGSTEDYIFHRGGNVKDTLENGLHTASGFLPEVMDKITWCTIWNAVKREVRHKYPRLTANSEAFLSMAGRRFDEVVNLTQVYDSTLTRSQAMRSRTTYMKSITAFMAEPTTGLNMLLDGLRRGGKAGAAAVGAWTASAILNAVLASVIYAGRDDDEDKTYLEKYLKSLSNEVLDGLNPLTAIPLVQDIWNLIQGWDADRADLSVIADIITNVKRAASKILKGDELAWKDYENSIGLILQAFGIPAKNISRDVRAVFQTVLSRPVSETQWYEILSGALPSLFPADKSAKLYYAITNGNTEYAERLRGTYKDDVAYHTGIRTALADTDPRIVQAAQALDDGDLEEYKRLVNAIKSMGFIQDDVVSAVNNKYNEMHKVDSEREFTEGKVSMYTVEHYVTSLAQGLGMEKEIFDELVRAYQVKNADKGYTQEEAETNVRKSIMSAVKEAYVETGVLDRKKTLEAMKGWMDADKAEETLKQWDYSKSVGAEWDDRYSTYYEAITEGTGDASKIKAEILKAGVEEKYIQQKVVDRVEDDYSSGRMTAAEAQNLLKQYGGLEAEEAQTNINVWDYMGRHPDTELDVEEIAQFYTKYKETGLPEANFEQYLIKKQACKGIDKDGDGRAENGTKKAQVMEVIDALPVSSEVKDALYFEEGYKASTLYEAPWR